METRSQVELPPTVTDPFEVFVNGVPQRAGDDYDRVGSALVFRRELQPERKLGFWRWLSIFFGIAGSYGKNDTVDVVTTVGGSRTVISLPVTPVAPGD